MVVGLLAEGLSVQKVEEGLEAEIVTMETPFYPEGGGQVGDRGEIAGPQGRFRVEDTLTTLPGFIVHRGTVMEGVVAISDPVIMQVDSGHRRDATRNPHRHPSITWGLEAGVGPAR